MNIIEEIGQAAALEQLAEECAELGKAALKLARIIRGENPTPVTEEEAEKNLREEIIDVLVCMDICQPSRSDFYLKDIYYTEKLDRWKQRIREMKEGEQHES